MRRILLCLCLLCLLMNGLAVWAHGDEDHTDDAPAPVIAVPAAELSYHEHVRPLLELNCAGCHSQGQIAGDIPLTDADAVVSLAADIAFHVAVGSMPPWMPSRANLPLKYDRSLSDAEIAIIAGWAQQGAALGDLQDYAPPAADAAAAPVRPDLTLQLREPYTPAAGLVDDYRCFAFPLDIDAPQFITGYEFFPDVSEMAHHAVIYLLGAEDRAVQERSAGDGQLGWTCYGGLNLPQRRSQLFGPQMLGTWTPGTSPEQFPPDSGFLTEPGDFVVLQMHYNLAITHQPDHSRLHLQLEPAASELTQLLTIPLTAPVEIPCPSGVSGPQCEREYALERMERLYGEETGRLSDSRLRNCGQTLADYADSIGENASTACDFSLPLPIPLKVYGVYGHMHELGRSFRMELNPDSENPLMLLDIPNWDFHWQDRYQFAEPLPAGFGDVLRMRCTWDNSLSAAPRYVVWGEGTTDEMCFGLVLVSVAV